MPFKLQTSLLLGLGSKSTKNIDKGLLLLSLLTLIILRVTRLKFSKASSISDIGVVGCNFFITIRNLFFYFNKKIVIKF